MRKGIALLIIGLFLSITVQAQQTAAGDEEITLQEAINIALENNYQLKQAANNVELSNKRLTGEKLDFAPSLSGGVSGFKDVGRQFIPGTGNFANTTVNGFNSSLNLDLNIFSGFENINSLRSQRFSTKSEKENKEWVREDIIFQTASNYLQVLLNKELLEIARENLASSRQQLKQVKAQVEVGSRPRVDLYNQQATVANNELEVTNRENDLNISRLQLVRSMQVDPRKEYDFATPKIDSTNIQTGQHNLQNLIDTALENRSDLQREQYNIKSLKYQLKSTKGSLYPSLSFSASISSGYNDQNINRNTGELFGFQDQFWDLNVNKSLGLSLNIPIFNGFDRRLNVQSQQINYQNAKLTLQNTRLQVTQEVTQAYNDYQSYVKRVQSTQKALQAAERTYKTQKERYEVGAGTLIELSDANAQYVQAQANQAQALYNLIFQRKLLDYYIGKLNRNMTLN